MRVLLTALLVLAAGCGGRPGAPAPAADVASASAGTPLSADSLAGTFDGWYSAGFEHTAFRPCADSTQRWWTEPALEFDGQPVAPESFADVGARYDRLFASNGAARHVEGPTVWARLRGRATPLARRTHGHLGQYDRRFLVDSVLVLTDEAPGDACARPPSLRY